MTTDQTERIIRNLVRQYIEDVTEMQRAYNALADKAGEHATRRYTMDPASVTAVRNARILLGEE
jgi:F0F1-type ATP synthase gamma subunit